MPQSKSRTIGVRVEAVGGVVDGSAAREAGVAGVRRGRGAMVHAGHLVSGGGRPRRAELRRPGSHRTQRRRE